MGAPESPFWVFGIAAKGRRLGLRLSQLPSLLESQGDYERAEGQVRLGPFRYTLRQLASELRAELPRAIRERAAARISDRR